MKTVCIATSTRADWGLLQPLAGALRDSGRVCLRIVATNMHLMEEFGMTVNEITEAGFTVDEKVNMRVDGDTPASRAKAMALCTAGMARAFERLRPDALIILGDRYEMLATAAAAAVMAIPIIHIAGGEISQGALDDSFRHAITKLASFHLCATEPYRRRVISMGEEPRRVVNTGAIGVWNAFNIPHMSAEELGRELDIDFSTATVAAVTYHPATCDSAEPPVARLQAMLDALDRFDELTLVVTAPNNDAGGASLLPVLEDYARRNPRRVRLVKSLGMRRYHSLLALSALCIGNSSSGIVEVPSAGIPTVDIGMRQAGRLAGPSVIHCGDSADEIADAIARALSPEMKALAAKKENPYYKADTLAVMTDAVLGFLDSPLLTTPKTFCDQ